MSTATATASKSRKSGRFQNYADLMQHTERPLKSRRELAIGRNGAKVQPRKFHLTADEITALKAEYAEVKPKRIPNPHNKGMYWGIWEALITLGINEEHAVSRVLKTVEKLLSSDDTKDGEGQTAWDRFANKDARNNETGKDLEGRFHQNVTVLQRLTGLTPYGLKFLQTCKEVCGFSGGVLDVLVHDTGTMYLRLNTKSDLPINQSKVRGMGSDADIAARKQAAREARKGKAKRKAKRVAKADAAPAVEAQPADAATASV